MELPEDFEFSQASLQDFTECRRRFKLRYIERLAWPAAQAEPPGQNEIAIQRGERFHRLAQQVLLGIPRENLDPVAAADGDEHIQPWWRNFSAFLPGLPTGRRFVELTLSTPIARQRIVAKYDLVVVSPEGDALIYDWKTTLKRPAGDWLRRRLQTRVYPYLLIRSGALLAGGQELTPAHVQMTYWFPNFPSQPERFVYSPEQDNEDQRYIRDLVETILAMPESGFALTPDEQRCLYCVYRSLCARGVRAGLWEESTLDGDEQGDMGPGLDYDQVAEVAF